MYNGFTEPQDVIEARKARILGKTPNGVETAPKADDNQMAKFASLKGDARRTATIFLVASLVNVVIGMALARFTP